MATGRGGSARLDEPMVHGCGKELWTAASYAIHAKHCDGTKPATSGRIAARSGSASSTTTEAKKQEPRRRPRRADPPRAKKKGSRSTVRPEKKGRRVKAALRGAVRRVEAAAVISPAAFLEALRAERAKIDAAIDALEALG